jgi:phage baseplate assembly protein W
MARSFLGQGWKFPVELDRAGGIALGGHDEVVRQSIVIILSTAPGERVMRPHFGCDIHELLFAPLSNATAALAAHHCVEALQKWEPRIDAVEAEAFPASGDTSRLDVFIKYRVRATNARRNLVYPFYIRRNEP